MNGRWQKQIVVDGGVIMVQALKDTIATKVRRIEEHVKTDAEKPCYALYLQDLPTTPNILSHS